MKGLIREGSVLHKERAGLGKGHHIVKECERKGSGQISSPIVQQFKLQCVSMHSGKGLGDLAVSRP